MHLARPQHILANPPRSPALYPYGSILIFNRDHNAAINIKYRAVGHPVLKAQEMSYAIAGVTEKPTLYASA